MPQRDRPVVTTEAAQPGQSLRPLPGWPSQWSPPRSWLTACINTGPSTAIPSRAPPLDPGRFTIKVRAATPATPRLSTAVAHHDQRRTERSPPRAVEPPARPRSWSARGCGLRTQPSAAGGDHHRVAHGNGIAQRGADLVAVGHDNRTRHIEPKIIKSRGDDRPRLVLVDPGSRAGGDCDHERALDHESTSRDQSPRRPLIWTARVRR